MNFMAGKQINPNVAKAGVDLLLAATSPSISEAKGPSMAMADTDIPYMISFVVRPDGTLLDGTPLKVAVQEIDRAVDPRPMAFMINCSHASFFKYESTVSEDPEIFARSVAALRTELGMKILGGCCGTDERHIRSLAGMLLIDTSS